MTAYDHIGSIAVVESRGQKLKQLKSFALRLLQQKSIKTVLLRSGGRKGRHRLYDYKHLAGVKTTETEHRESGVRIKLDVAKCYFSPRLSNERLRIAKQVKKGEKVLVMFSGVAPYPLIIAKHANPKKIVGVEINKTAHKFAVKNLTLNKMNNVIGLIQGDVKKIIPRMKGKFDRIVMPFPLLAAKKYFKTAFKAAKKGTTINLYIFSEDKLVWTIPQTIIAECRKNFKKCKVLRIVKAGDYAPRKKRMCADFKIF